MKTEWKKKIPFKELCLWSFSFRMQIKWALVSLVKKKKKNLSLKYYQSPHEQKVWIQLVEACYVCSHLVPKEINRSSILISQSHICIKLSCQGRRTSSPPAAESSSISSSHLLPSSACISCKCFCCIYNSQLRAHNTKLPQAKSITPRGLTHLRLLHTKKWW